MFEISFSKPETREHVAKLSLAQREMLQRMATNDEPIRHQTIPCSKWMWPRIWKPCSGTTANSLAVRGFIYPIRPNRFASEYAITDAGRSALQAVQS